MRAKQIQGSDIQSPEDLKDIDLWSSFKYKNTSLRCVPTAVNGGESQTCRSCYFERSRRVQRICDGMCVCCAHTREDHVSVKFISADLNCITDERMREMAHLADLKNRW